MREIHNDDIVQCVEYEPQCRTVRINERKYYLSLPYMQFATILRKPIRHNGKQYLYKSFHATFTNKPLESIDSPSFLPLLPSIYPRRTYPQANCQVCLPRRRYTYSARCSDDIFEMISIFWQSKFEIKNDWLALHYIKKTRLKTYLIWSEKTQEDPTFITDTDWPVQVTISDFGNLSYQSYCSVFVGSI